MAMASDGELEGWRYVFEALRNVRCLQLLLFHRALTPECDCLEFTAVVRHGSLHCAWMSSPAGTPDEAGDYDNNNSLVVALPACLLDLSLPVRCWTRQDHVEVRLGLLSLDPALHLLQLSLEDESLDLNAVRQADNNAKPFSVDFDAQALESGDGVQFFCRACSCQLTNAHFRRIIEVPSLDWREVSEHFYGNCCCASFGAQAELLVARFQQLLTSSEGTCLVASTTCIVHEGDVIISEGDRDVLSDPVAAKSLHGGKNESDSCPASHSGSDIGLETTHVHIANRENGSAKAKCCEVDRFNGDGFEHQSIELTVASDIDSKLNHLQIDEHGRATVSAAEEIQEACASGSEVSPEGFERNTHQGTEEEPCCSSRCSSRNPASTESSSLKEGKASSPESLGNGFMTGPGSQSEVLDWEPFFCRSCSSLVGARRGDSSKNGIQFFKCNISTHKSVQSSSNIFREHTLERLFTHEVEKNTESNSSYRYVVRSFQSGAALLQLVLLNQNALVSSGTCPLTKTSNSGYQADHTELGQTHDRKAGYFSLNTVAKFMFRDCRMLGLEELSLIDKWAQLQKADDIFVLDDVAEPLIDSLKSHQLAYPTSCQSFEKFGMSFLTK